MNVNELIERKLVHSIHNSQRMSHRGCKRRHDWIYHHGYYPMVTPKPLEFGVAYHVAMQTYYEPKTWHDKETAAALALVAFVATCDEQYKAFSKLNPQLVSPEVKTDYEERKELGLGMLKHYFKWVSPTEDAGLTPVKVEISFEVPIEGPNRETIWCKCDRCFAKWMAQATPDTPCLALCRNTHQYPEWSEHEYRDSCWKGLPVTFGGRIDCLMKDSLGRWWIVDWKTAAKLSTGEPGADDDYLYLDDQITGYCWALWRLGFPIAGFIYAEMKKAFPEEPEPLKSVRLGRSYSVSQQINTTYEMYCSTVQENDPVAFANGSYDDFLEFLKGPKGPRYHLRHQIHRTDHELVEAGVNLYNEAQDIVDPNSRIYPEPGRFGCNFCAFKDPCKSKNRGEDFIYTLETMFEKRTKHYYEEEKPSTEKAG